MCFAFIEEQYDLKLDRVALRTGLSRPYSGLFTFKDIRIPEGTMYECIVVPFLEITKIILAKLRKKVPGQLHIQHVGRILDYDLLRRAIRLWMVDASLEVNITP